MIVIRYLCSTTKCFHTFVANRLAIILEGSNSCQGHPADDASRGLDAKQMLSSMRVQHGPSFSVKDETIMIQIVYEVVTV